MQPQGIEPWYSVCFVLFVLFDSVSPSQQSFSYKGTGIPGLKQYLTRINVHAQGYNTVRLEPATPRSRVKHSTAKKTQLGVTYITTAYIGIA